MSDEVSINAAPADFDAWVKLVFDHEVIEPSANRWYWEQIDFQVSDPAVLLAHMTRLFRNFPEVVAPYSLPQVDQGIWFLLCEPIHSGEYLMRTTIPLDVRLECIRSMYHVYSDFVAKSKVAVMENCFDMWWDFVCGDCWNELQFSSPRRKINERAGGYDVLTAEEKVVFDTMYETLAKILKLKEQRCTAFALHGLGHLHHPLGRNLVQKFIVHNRRDFTPEGIKWLESCRDGTVM